MKFQRHDYLIQIGLRKSIPVKNLLKIYNYVSFKKYNVNGISHIFFLTMSFLALSHPGKTNSHWIAEYLVEVKETIPDLFKSSRNQVMWFYSYLSSEKLTQKIKRKLLEGFNKFNFLTKRLPCRHTQTLLTHGHTVFGSSLTSVKYSWHYQLCLFSSHIYHHHSFFSYLHRPPLPMKELQKFL